MVKNHYSSKLEEEKPETGRAGRAALSKSILNNGDTLGNSG